MTHWCTNFHRNRTNVGGVIMSYRFSRWRSLWRALGDVGLFTKVKVYRQTKFRWNNSIHGWNITISGFEKQTSAILKFFFWFRPWPHPQNRHVILHQAAKFHPYQTFLGGDIISVFKMATAMAQFYFRLRFGWVTFFRWSIPVSTPNFVRITQSTAEI